MGAVMVMMMSMTLIGAAPACFQFGDPWLQDPKGSGSKGIQKMRRPGRKGHKRSVSSS